MAKIAPSILSADFANLERDIHDLERNGADWVHVDIMDGIFVPNISIGIPVVQALRPVTDLPLDVHLMIDRPIRYVEQFAKAGADWITVHVEADQPQNILDTLDKIHELGCKAGIVLKPRTPAEVAIPYLEKSDLILVMTVEPGFGGQKFMADQMDKIHELGCKAGIVLKPKTPAEAAIPYLEKCDMILVMTVEPGFGGQKFMADMMPKVTALRKMIDEKNPACELEVDGGVDANTCGVCNENGADVLVAGSAYFKATDRAAFVKTIQA